MLIHGLVLAAVSAATPDDAALCGRVTALANRGELDAALLRPAPIDADATERWTSGGAERYGTVVGQYVLDPGGARPTTLLAIADGGSCRWLTLAFEGGDELALEPLLVPENDFGVDRIPARIGADWIVLAAQRARSTFTPIAVARLAPDAVTPLCRLREAGVRRVAVDDDAVCAALAAGDITAVQWTEAAHGAGPEPPTIPVDGAHAPLDWNGTGTMRTTWLMRYESGAGCGATYEWLGLDAGSEKPAIDLDTPLGQALFEKSGNRFGFRPWRIDRVFTHQGRAYLAGQADDVDSAYDYAVYRFDADGAHVQCRYRYLQQYAVE